MTALPYKIVIADDSGRLRDLLRESLEAIDGVQVTGCATDGEEAIALVRTLTPDALVLDVRMPRANGFRVMEALQDLERFPTVIVCTNYPFPEYKARAVALGARFFVDKGKDLAHVKEIIADLVSLPGGRSDDAH